MVYDMELRDGEHLAAQELSNWNRKNKHILQIQTFGLDTINGKIQISILKETNHA